MSRRLELEVGAINSAARFLSDDPAGVRAVLAALDLLLDDPTPDTSRAFGAGGLRRLRVGRYRALYSVTVDRVW